MYTEFHFNSELRKDTPGTIIDVLKYMTGSFPNYDFNMPPDHEFFKCERWCMLFTCDSYFFDAVTHSVLHKDKLYNEYYLCIRSNIKNFDSEIEKFIDWIMPYLDKYDGEFLGFSRYEESEKPKLIYAKKDE